MNMNYVDVFELLCVNTATNSVVSSSTVYLSVYVASLQLLTSVVVRLVSRRLNNFPAGL